MADTLKGVALFAHGSPEAQWKIPFEKLEQRLSEKLGEGTMVMAAYLRECEPGIFQAVTEMVDSGCEKITIAPIFLSAGAHVEKDFPVIASRLEEKHPDVKFEWTDVIGKWPEAQDALAGALAQRFSE